MSLTIIDIRLASLAILLIRISLSLGEPIPFKGKSFSIRSSIRRVLWNSEDDATYTELSRMKESYSNQEKRARIDFEQFVEHNETNAKEEGQIKSFYLDSQRDVALLIDRINLNCAKSSVNELTRLIGMNSSQAGSIAPSNKLIVGPARLLFFVAKKLNLQKFEPTRKRLIWRNLTCFMYTFYHVEQEGSSYKVLFSENALNSANNANEFPIPLMIKIERVGEKTLFEYLFSQPQILNEQEEDDAINLSEQHIPSKDLTQTKLSRFTFEPNLGCARAIDKSKEKFLFNGKEHSSAKQFSFRANLLYTNRYLKNSIELSTFVAYHEAINSLRLDRSYSKDKSGTRRQLFNFKLNRVYHIFERVPYSRGLVDKVLDLSHNNNPDSLDSRTETNQCVMAKIFNETRTTPTINDLLVGTGGFVYLGKAIVRGLSVGVYEARSGSLPLWLDMPIEYENQNGQWSVRDPSLGMIKNKQNNLTTFWNVVVYVKGQEEGKLLESIVLIEVYKFEKTSITDYKISQRYVISIQDFSWTINKSPNGDKVEDTFSLKEFCTSSSGLDYHSRYDLYLESIAAGKLSANTSLSSINSRRAALLSAIQKHFRLPATMIYDLESKLIEKSSDRGKGKKKSSIIASFKLAEHTKNLVSIKYLGQGKPFGNSESIKATGYVRTFEACYFLASHLKYNIYFSYNPTNLICYIDTKPASEYNITGSKNAFGSFSSNYESMADNEIYITKHDKLAYRDWIFGQSGKQYHETQVLGSLLELYDLNANLSVPFRVIKVHIDESQSKDKSINQEDNDYDQNNKQVQNRIADKIKGFGYIIEDEIDSNSNKLVQLIEPATIKGNDNGEAQQSEMTLDQCQANCLSNFECQSYSVCLQSSTTKCIISSINFKASKILKQINEHKNSKFGSKLSIQVGFEGGVEQQQQQNAINLIKHPLCNLYNKLYVNFVDHGGLYRINHNYRAIYQSIDGLEGCARICVEKNLITLAQDVEFISELTKTFKKSSPSGELQHVEVLRNLRNKHQDRISEQVCESFYFLDRETFVSLPLELQQDIEGKTLNKNNDEYMNQTASYSYCIFSRNSTNRKENEEIISELEKKRDVDVSIYHFKFDTFYDQKSGINLRASPITYEEEEAFDLVSSSNGLEHMTSDSFELIRAFTLEGKNHLTIGFGKYQVCANRCFCQTSPTWPACRSFSLITEIGIDSQFNSRCHYNSITLGQALENNMTNLIEKNNTSFKHQVVHFEPKLGFVFKESILRGELRLAQDSFNLMNMNLNLKPIASFKFYGFGLFLLSFVAIICGVIIGLQIGRRTSILNSSSTNQQQTASTTRPSSMDDVLVERSVEFDFLSLSERSGSVVAKDNR